MSLGKGSGRIEIILATLETIENQSVLILFQRPRETPKSPWGSSGRVPGALGGPCMGAGDTLGYLDEPLGVLWRRWDVPGREHWAY